MKHKKTEQRINIRISRKARTALRARARKEGRTIIETLDAMLKV